MVEKRIYQVWKGSNTFLLAGRLIFGPDVRSLAVTIFLIVAPAVIFCVLVAGRLLHQFPDYNSGIAVVVVAVIFTIYVLVLLLLTSGRDPGIIPRNPHPPELDDDEYATSSADWVGGQTPRLRLPRVKDVLVNGHTVKIKYCDTCMLYRPPRCSHCSICNNCVERFDHHCPWVGQCIGQRNYRFFFMFVSSTTLLCIYVFAFSALLIKFLMDGDSDGGNTSTVWKAMAKSPASVVLMIYTFIAVWFVGGLTIFHLYLISTNQTTYENFRYRYDNRMNPYNLGVIRNFYDIFCIPVQPSKNLFRKKVQLDASGQIVSNSQPPVSSGNAGELEIGIKPSLEAGMNESIEEARARMSGTGDIGLGIKDGFDDVFASAMEPPVSLDSGDPRGGHPRRSSWGRSWEMTPDILALASGHIEAAHSNGDGNEPPDRDNENTQQGAS